MSNQYDPYAPSAVPAAPSYPAPEAMPSTDALSAPEPLVAAEPLPALAGGLTAPPETRLAIDGGTLRMESQPGATTFTLLLPAGSE